MVRNIKQGYSFSGLKLIMIRLSKKRARLEKRESEKSCYGYRKIMADLSAAALAAEAL